MVDGLNTSYMCDSPTSLKSCLELRLAYLYYYTVIMQAGACAFHLFYKSHCLRVPLQFLNNNARASTAFRISDPVAARATPEVVSAAECFRNKNSLAGLRILCTNCATHRRCKVADARSGQRSRDIYKNLQMRTLYNKPNVEIA